MRIWALCAITTFFGWACTPDIIDHSEGIVPSARPLLDCSGVIIEATDPLSTGLELRTVSESGGLPISDVAIQIDNNDWILTDSDGRASVSAPSGPFDVRVHQVIAVNGLRVDDVWEFQDLTANVLTFCVDGFLVLSSSVALSGSVVDAEGPNRVAIFTPGSTSDPQQTYQDTLPIPGGFNVGSRWEGDDAHEVEIFAVEHASPAPIHAFDAPTEYFSFGHQIIPVASSATRPREISGIALAMESVEQGTISGEINGANLHRLQAHLSLEVRTYDLQLGLGAVDASRGFSIAYPEVDGARLALDVAGVDADGSVGLHSRRVDRASGLQSFDIPVPIQMIAPVGGSTITPEATTFTWSPGPSNGRTSLRFGCTWHDGIESRGITYRHIESSNGQATLPVIPGLTIGSEAYCRWWVSWYERVSPDESRSARGREHYGRTN